MKKFILISFLFCAFSVKAQQNLILNGSFGLFNLIVDSLGTSPTCQNDLVSKADYDNTVLNSNHFGDENTITFWELPCLVCLPQVLWGGGAKEGTRVLILYGEDYPVYFPTWTDTVHIIKEGKISLELDSPLSEEKRYKLSFWIKDPPSEVNNCLKQKNNYVNVGISNYNDQLGRHLITTNYGDTLWQEYSYVFETQDAEEYLTVTVGVNDTIDYGVFIDHFVLTETQEPLTTGINEISQEEKKLLKIVDILGRESKSKNGLLFYIYSDGTVEKKIIIE